MDIKAIMGRNLRALRRNRKYSQIEFSGEFGISQSKLSKIENGLNELSAFELMKISEKFKEAPDLFFDPEWAGRLISSMEVSI